jgi:hypothetical protein
MSRQNKVNPGMYTQRGRLTQDDAARELKRQREVGSQHTWQPVKKDQRPRPTSSHEEDPDSGTETTEDTGKTVEAPAEVQAATRTAKAKTAKAKTKVAKAKTSAKKPATKSAAAPKRTAVLARNVGGGGAKPRAARKRRKS